MDMTVGQAISISCSIIGVSMAVYGCVLCVCGNVGVYMVMII